MKRYDGEIAVVTGASSGIGRRIARDLAGRGAVVVGIARRKNMLDELRAELRRSSPSSETVVCDVSDATAFRDRLSEIGARHGRIDILVTSAGTNISGDRRNFNNLTAEAWDEVVAINLNGLFYCCLAVIPGMRASKDGLIIIISSWAGRYASKLTGPAYNATKRAVIAA